MTIQRKTGSVAGNITSMLLGRVLGAGLSWAGSITIARALDPTGWGQYSFVFALLGVMSVITDLGVGRVVLARLVGDEDDTDSRLVASSFIALRAALGVLGYVAALLFVVIAGYPREVIVATAVAGLVIVVATPSHALTVLFQSRLRLTVVAVIESVGQVVQLAGTVLAVLVAPVLLVVVIPAVAFEVVSISAKMWITASGGLGIRPARRIEIRRWAGMLREAFPLSIGFALTVLLSKIDVPILSKIGSFDAVGHYAIAYKFADLVSMIGIAITTPVTAVLVSAWPSRPGEFRSRIHDAAVLTTLLAGMAVIGIWPAATPLIHILYGSDYVDAGMATRLLVLSAGISSFTLLGVMALVSAGRNRVFPIIAGFGLVLNVVGNVVLIPRHSFDGSAVATIATETIVCLFIWVAVRRELGMVSLVPWRRIGGLLVLIAILTTATTALSPTDSVAGIAIGTVGALMLPVAAHGLRLNRSREPRPSSSGESVPDSHPSQPYPTYFGPPDTPVFGTLHIPADGTARAGIVLCGSLGKEQMDTTRGLKSLADDLADRGIVALRLDYLHTGESWGEQQAPDALEHHIASVGYAVDHLRGMGIAHIVLLGLRAGALIATAAAARLDDPAALVLWDPVMRGRTFVRGQQQLFRMAVAADSGGVAHGGTPDAPTVDVVGATWHRDTAAGLSAMTVSPEALPDCPILLAVSDADVDSTPISTLTRSATLTNRLDVRTIGDTTGFISPRSFYVAQPRVAVDVVGRWVDDQAPTIAVSIAPVAARTASTQCLGDTAVTTEVSTSPDGAQLWVTRPAEVSPHAALVVHSTANDLRTGPARLWHETATRAAALGAVVVRYDRRGVGESGRVNRDDDFAPLNSSASLRDARFATDLARSQTDGPVTHVGVCSGAWASARMALDSGAGDRVILTNLLTWRVRTPEIGADALDGIYASPQQPSTSIRSRLKPHVARWTPPLMSDLVARAGVMQNPYLLLRPLTRAGVDTHLIFGSDDYEHFTRQRGLEALGRVSRHGSTPVVHVAAGGDHPAFHPAVRETTLAVCLWAIEMDRSTAR